ncbi:MAG: hypothetical protein KJ646_04830 [Nanoarchaeota archaeon]|nr:hypothetical protein [Nanoarchaeota archaeon]MBU4117044.1 hypothetical protein [Nanoarchaeota archaeon]
MKYSQLENIGQVNKLKIGDIIPIIQYRAGLDDHTNAMIEHNDEEGTMIFLAEHGEGNYLRHLLKNRLEGEITPDKRFGFSADNTDTVICTKEQSLIKMYKEMIKK